jgi:hypothetical protein
VDVQADGLIDKEEYQWTVSGWIDGGCMTFANDLPTLHPVSSSLILLTQACLLGPGNRFASSL